MIMYEFIDISSQTQYTADGFREAIQDVLRLISTLMRTGGEADARTIGRTIFVLQWMLDDVIILDGMKPKRTSKGSKK